VNLHHWHRAAEVPFSARLIVASRPGERLDCLDAYLPPGLALEDAPVQEESSSDVELRCYLLRNQAGEQAPFYLLPGLDVEISASAIRAQISAGAGNLPTEQALLAGAVSEYIRSRGLYR
jgi:nicotinic acid mononucleotide adenylyltransferase